MRLAGPDEITATTNVDALVTRFPRVALVFVRRRMACVDCPVARFETVADVCQIYRQPLDMVLADLRLTVSGATTTAR